MGFPRYKLQIMENETLGLEATNEQENVIFGLLILVYLIQYDL
jgi:hypothetical protein